MPMTRPPSQSPELAVSLLVEQLLREPHLGAEVLRARREFFGVDVGAALPAAAEHRFAEWLLCERESETLGTAPVDLPRFANLAAPLVGSIAGVYLATAASGGEVEVLDLQTEETIDLDVPPGSLQPGDLVVGRLFATSDGMRPSTAAAIFRPGASLAEAFRRDLERIAPGRRLQQAELEHLLLRQQGRAAHPTAPATGAPIERLEADLEQLLTAGGSELGAAAISRRLAGADRPGQVMGPVLEQLAWGTRVDLDRVRQLLLEIWNAYRDRAAATAPAPEPADQGSLGERLVRALDDGLARHQDVDDVFAQLERMAGLEAGAADDEENPFDRDEGDGAPAVGNLAALVEEYLWETGRTDPARSDADAGAAALRALAGVLANAPLPHVDIEEVTGQDLARLLLHVYVTAPAASRAAVVRATFVQLERFYAWLASAQELELAAALGGCRSGLLDHAERLTEAGLRLSTATDPGAHPTVLRVLDLGARGGFGVVDDEGEHHWLAGEAAAVGCLQVGDLVLGAVAADPAGKRLAGVVVVLPHDAREMIE